MAGRDIRKSMESWQSGLLRLTRNQKRVKPPGVQISHFPFGDNDMEVWNNSKYKHFYFILSLDNVSVVVQQERCFNREYDNIYLGCEIHNYPLKILKVAMKNFV